MADRDERPDKGADRDKPRGSKPYRSGKPQGSGGGRPQGSGGGRPQGSGGSRPPSGGSRPYGSSGGSRPSGSRPTGSGSRSYGSSGGSRPPGASGRSTSGGPPGGSGPGRPTGQPYRGPRRDDRPYGQDRPSSQDRPSDSRPRYDARPPSARPGYDRPRYDRPRDDSRPAERPPYARPTGDRPPYDRPRNDRPGYGRPPGPRPGGQRDWQQRGDRPQGRPYPVRPQRTPITDVSELMSEGDELVAGRRPVEEAFAAHREAVRLLVVPERRAALDALVVHATTLRIPVVELEGGSLTALAGFDGHQGVALVAKPRQTADVQTILAAAKAREESPFVLVLDSLEDPQNFGTLLRSGEAVGVHGVIYPSHHAAPLTPSAIKASAGATEHLLLAAVDDLPGALADLHARGLRIVAAEEDAALSYVEADLRGPLAFVIGSEGKGISAAVRRRLDLSVRIPMSGRIGSLNAAVAGSILLFAAAQQRPTRAAPADQSAAEEPAKPDEPAKPAQAAKPGKTPKAKPKAKAAPKSKKPSKAGPKPKAEAKPKAAAKPKATSKSKAKPKSASKLPADDELLPSDS